VEWAWLDDGGHDVESGELTACVGDVAEPLSSSPFVYTQFDDVISQVGHPQSTAPTDPPRGNRGNAREQLGPHYTAIYRSGGVHISQSGEWAAVQ